MRRRLSVKPTKNQALVLVVALLFALAWAVPSLGAKSSKLARTALGRANEAFYKSNVAISTSNTASGTANAAKTAAGAAQATANTANSTANTALSAANGALHAADNFTSTLDPNSIAGGSCTSSQISRLGVLASDQVIVTPPDTQDIGIITQALTSANQVTLEFCNVTSGAINPPAGGYEFSILH